MKGVVESLADKIATKFISGQRSNRMFSTCGFTDSS